jgi:lysosomal alpha-mannosidase
LNDLDDSLQLSILTDRSQGATSLENNKLEIMVHRKTLKDDKKGVSEALNEKAFGYGLVARGKHHITVLNPTTEGWKLLNQFSN